MTAGTKMAALTIAFWIASLQAGRAQLITARKIESQQVVSIRADVSGEVSISAWSRDGGRELTPVLPEVIHCTGSFRTEGSASNSIVCPRALRHDGLALEEVIDLAPVARSLDPSIPVQLWLNGPLLGFESESMAMTEEEGTAERWSRSLRFDAGSPPPPIRIRFGYKPDQMAGIYLPLVVLALALTGIAVIIARAGLAALSRSAVLLGTIVWMGAAAQLQADAPLRILLYGTPWASLVPLAVEFWPPLFCIAFGVAIGSRMRPGQQRSGKAGEILGSLAVIPLILTCVVGALPSMTGGDWPVAVIWLAAAPVILILRRAWLRAGARSRVRQLVSGEIKERVSAMAAKAGCPQVKIYVSYSTRSDTANAFALPGKCIFLTAPLIRRLSKREVDAVAAHELSHFRHSGRGVWVALCLAMLLCGTPARDIALSLPGGVLAAMLAPIIIFLVSLRGMRKREFAADAGAAALTGDPRAMISSLARIARNNSLPLAMSPVAEWFSSHPSTPKRIRALAAAARLEAAEVEGLCASDDPGVPYELPQEEIGTAIFTPAWQKANAGMYGWVVIFASSGAGLLVAILLYKLMGARPGGGGAMQLIAGIAAGCALTKALAALSMSGNFARLHRRLEARLGVGGQLVGLAMESEPRLYNGFRFSDAGLLRFEGGRLCYRSERVAIELDPADVVEVGMVAASPSTWVRRQPMVRFRMPDSGSVQAFILHPVGFLPTQRRLLGTLERWRATESPAEKTAVSGFDPPTGQLFTSPTILEAARGFLVPGSLTLLAAISIRLLLQAEWWFVGCALAVSACSHLFMFLPAMLYRAPALPRGIAARADAS